MQGLVLHWHCLVRIASWVEIAVILLALIVGVLHVESVLVFGKRLIEVIVILISMSNLI